MIDMDDIISQLSPMFLEDAREKLAFLFEAAAQLPDGDRRSENYLNFLRQLHSIKGAAASFGFPFLGVICHRLEDYLAKTPHASPRAVRDIVQHLTQCQAIVEAGRDPTESRGYALLKELPYPPDFDDAIHQKALYALFIGPRDVQFRILEIELRECGIRSTIASQSFHGIELAVRTRPDFIMVTYIVDVLDGIEVLRMLRSVRSLARTPMMLLKSELSDEKARQAIRAAVPPGVEVVRKGRLFSDDFANALTALKIL